MMHLAEAYNDAAKRLAAVADELAANPANPDAPAAALRATLAVLGHLSETATSLDMRSAHHQLGATLHAAGTITPDKIREIAHNLNSIAENYAQVATGWNNIWA
jgi:hypothetical protein